MNQLRKLLILGFILIAMWAFGIMTPPIASADLAGLLLLPMDKGMSKIVTFDGEGETSSLATAAGKSIVCTNLKALNGQSKEEGEHIILGTADITLTGCKEKPSELNCKTEGAAKGIITLSVDWHLFDALNAGNELEPGIAFSILASPQKITCGSVGIVEVKGAELGLDRVGALTSDVSASELDFIKAGEKCDTAMLSTYCKEVHEKEPFLANFTGTYEKAEEETKFSVTLSKMVLVDD